MLRGTWGAGDISIDRLPADSTLLNGNGAGRRPAVRKAKAEPGTFGCEWY